MERMIFKAVLGRCMAGKSSMNDDFKSKKTHHTTSIKSDWIARVFHIPILGKAIVLMPILLIRVAGDLLDLSA